MQSLGSGENLPRKEAYLLDCAWAATNTDFDFEWGTLAADEPVVRWPSSNGLDVVVERDVSENELQLLGGKESARAVNLLVKGGPRSGVNNSPSMSSM